MSDFPRPPDTYLQFIQAFPKLGEAWKLAQEAGADGPLDDKAQRLIKLAVAIGNMREGAVHSAVRKAIAVGVTEAEIAQVIALAGSVLGFPSTVAVFSWVERELQKGRS